MNELDRMELHELRAAMLHIFMGVATVPGDEKAIEKYMALNDRHQAIIAGDIEDGEMDEAVMLGITNPLAAELEGGGK